MTPPVDGDTPWMATEATVTGCRFQFARMNTLTFGIQRGEKFRITFDYYAHGRLYSDEFQSPVAIAQGEHIPLNYNPLKPSENSRSSGSGGGAGGRANPLIGIGVLGSVILSLLWLAILRGCN